MSKGLFVTATGTDVGKTYVTALIIKKLREAGVNAGYYKAALSGAQSIAESDAGYVNRIARIGESEDMLLSYLYKNAYSPHLAARLEGRPVEMDEVKRGFGRAASAYEYLTVEGSGGIVCPIRKDEQAVIFLEDIIKALGLASVVVADSGLGTINAVVTTVEYMRSRGLRVKGVILNRWNGSVMQRDNREMIEWITGLPVIAAVKENAAELDADARALAAIYDDIGGVNA